MSDEINELKDGLPKSAFAKSSDQVRVRTDRYRQLYANNLSVSLTTWDVALTFGEIIGEQEGKPIIEETTKILITREMTKVLATLLNTHIRLYEERFGEIKLPNVESDTEASAEPGTPEETTEPESLS